MADFHFKTFLNLIKVQKTVIFKYSNHNRGTGICVIISTVSEDILYFTQITATDIADNALTIPAYEAGMQIKLSGNINGVHTVVKTVAE